MTYGKKTKNPGFQRNNHWVRCEVCDFDYRVKDIKTRWDGVLVCKWDWEPRHPQDLVRGVSDDTSPVGPINPEPSSDTFTSVTHCISQSAIPGIAIPGCAIPNNTHKYFTNDYDVPSGTTPSDGGLD